MALRMPGLVGLVVGLAVTLPLAWPRAEARPPSPAPAHGHGEPGVECVCLEWASADGRRVAVADLVAALELETGQRLMARERADAVQGAVSVAGGTRVWVCLYTAPRGPAGGRTSTLAECPAAVRATVAATLSATCERIAR